MKTTFEFSTHKERAAMLAAGMREITPTVLRKELAALGYSLGEAFNYTNTHNRLSYLARSIYIRDVKTGFGFANVKACRDNLSALQALRFSSFCFHRGRIWEF
jgi:hypothetical protein